MRTALRLTALLTILPLALQAQSIPYANYTYSGGFLQTSAPADAMDLRNSAGASVGKAWVQHWQNGLAVFGRVDGPAVKWARFPAEFGSAGHIKVLLSIADKVPMPEIGWGNQFGDTNCARYAVENTSPSLGAENCATWSARQVLYREQFRRLFLREWTLAPGTSSETLATDAYGKTVAFADDFSRRRLTGLAPKVSSDALYYGTPDVRMGGAERGWTFQAFIPWALLPPSPSLEVSRLNAVVEIHDGSRLVASTAAGHKRDDPTSFNHLTFSRPLSYRVARCGYPLETAAADEGYRTAWFFPTADSVLSDTFSLVNESGGYRYDPEGLSPIPNWKHYFTKDLGNNVVVCGPNLRLLAGGRTWDAADTIDEEHLQQFQLPDGSYLLKSGPTLGSYSPFGSGRCGACPTYQVSVHRLDQGITRLFSDFIRIDPGDIDDGDIQFSADWKTITIYKGVDRSQGLGRPALEWSSTRYCLSNSNTYQACGPGPAGPPPAPRQIPPQVIN